MPPKNINTIYGCGLLENPDLGLSSSAECTDQLDQIKKNYIKKEFQR